MNEWETRTTVIVRQLVMLDRLAAMAMMLEALITASTSSHHSQRDVEVSINCSREDIQTTSSLSGRTPIPLIDYILNIMKFVDAILSNISTDDHCREFVNQDGLGPLLKILSLPYLRVDSPITASAQLVQLYTALVWESALLLALCICICTDDIIPVGCDFGKEDLDKLPKEKLSDQTSATSDSGSS